MGKFEQEAKDLLAAIGGKENVTAVTHCATRMRFVLGDDKKADVKTIEAIPAVKGTFTNAGQFQVIIGNDVPIFYNDFTGVSGIEGVSKEAAKSAAKSKQNPVQRVMTTLAEIFTPIIPALIVGGLILGFRNVLEGVHWSMLDGKTITEVSQFWSGVNHFLWLPGEAIFQFLPVGITWSVSRKMGTSQILGIVLGICLVSPQLLNAYSVASTPASEIAKDWVWDFGFFTVNRIGYQAQVIPALLAGLSLSYLEIFWRNRSSINDFCTVLVIDSSPYFGSYGFRSYWLDYWTSSFNSGSCWFDRSCKMAFRCCFWCPLCAVRYHWSSPHDQCN